MYAIDELLADREALGELARSLDSLQPPSLRCAKIKITSRCNLRCAMCAYWKRRTESALSTARWAHVLDGLANSGCRKVHFSGGEVFVRRDFLDLVEHASGLGMKVNLTTNGTLLGRDEIRRLLRARVNSVSLSLDGPRAEVHDAIRGVAGSFERTCRAVRDIRRLGERYGRTPRLRLNFVVMRDNWRRLPEMLELAAVLGATELHPMPVDEKGEARRRLSRRQVEAYNAEIAPRVLALRAQHGFSTDASLVYPFGTDAGDARYARQGLYARGFYEKRPCLGPWTHLFLAWDGEAYPCCMINGRMPSLGCVRDAEVRDVFWGDDFRRIRASFIVGHVHPACHRCDMFLGENRRLHEALATMRRTASAAAAAPPTAGPRISTSSERLPRI